MYEAFYGFKDKPFSMLPDPSFLFLSKKHQAALTLLEYGLLNHVGFCIISGEAGAGKTTILRSLLLRVPDDVTVGLISNTHQSFGGLLDWVLSAFDLHQPGLTQVEMHQVFIDYLIKEYANKRSVLLIVDEAQNMKPDTLEELRMLSNVNTEKDQLMQVVLSGQPALKEMLSKPELMQFAQRIGVDYHLKPLDVKETCGYIQHRLVKAGAVRNIFTPAACERIHCYSGGTPRLINLLCETVLVYGFADQQDMVDVGLVDEMVQEQMKDSVVPIVNRDTAAKDNKVASKALEKDFPWIKSKAVTQAAVHTVTPAATQMTTQTQTVAPAATQTTEPKAEPPINKKPQPVTVPEKSFRSVNSVDVKREAPENKIKKEPTLSSQSVEKKTDSNSISLTANQEGEKGKPFIKYGVLAGVIIFALVALLLNIEKDASKLSKVSSYLNEVLSNMDVISQTENDNKALESQMGQGQGDARIKQLQMEIEKLKKERDAAMVKAEEDKRAKQEAERLAADKADLAIELAEESRKLEE